MKKLLKIDVCGIREQCTNTLFMADLVNKAEATKKKKKKADLKRKRHFSTIQTAS